MNSCLLRDGQGRMTCRARATNNFIQHSQQVLYSQNIFSKFGVDIFDNVSVVLSPTKLHMMIYKRSNFQLSIFLLLLILPVTCFSQNLDNRRMFRSYAIDSALKIGDTVFTYCFADKYSTPVCEFKCDYLNSIVIVMNSIKHAYLDIYIIRDLDENYNVNEIKNGDFEQGYFKWDFDRVRFVKSYFQCRGMSLPMYCHVIGLENKKKFRRRVIFPNDQLQKKFVFVVIRDSSIVCSADSLFKKEIDILPAIGYDSLTGSLRFSSTEMMAEIGNFLRDNPDKKAVISLKSNVMQSDSVNSKVILSFRKSFLTPMGLMGLTPENIVFSIAWPQKKPLHASKKPIESLLLNMDEK